MKTLAQSQIMQLSALLILAVALPLFAPPYYVQFASKALLLSILAVSLNLIVGFGGLVSLCHAAFFGLGGYMLGFMSSDSAGASVAFCSGDVDRGWLCCRCDWLSLAQNPRHLFHHGHTRLWRNALLPLP